MLEKYLTKLFKLSFVLVFALLFLHLGNGRALASEGIFELRATTNENYRCFVVSLQNQNNQFQILVSCRDLIYPAEGDIFSYILWARPVDGDGPVKLGPLEFGKVQFKVDRAFSNLFVTTEQEKRTREPQGNLVMTGSLQPIEFLERPASPTPTPEEDGENGEEVVEVAPEEEVQEQMSTKEKLIVGLKRAGIIAGFALVALIGLIFVITRMRG